MAEQWNQDRTGAPGSNSTCSPCHNNPGNTDATSAFDVVDPATNESVTSYLAGQDYLVRMVVESSNASRYGAQGTAVFADGSNAGAFSMPASNVQLEDVNGRHIVEQNALSNSNVFEVTWTAPASGSGDAIFYMSGLQRRRARWATTTAPRSARRPQACQLSPADAPHRQFGQWTWTAPSEGQFVVADLAGRVHVKKPRRTSASIKHKACT